jgi:hypothetical protein
MKKMKTKRYQEGMSVEGDYESSDDYKNLMGAAAREKADAEKSATPAAPAKAASFGEAFKSARGRGDKTFEYMGKKYTTEMAGGKKAPAAKSFADTQDREAGARVTRTERQNALFAENKPKKSSSYGEAARSARTLGDVMKEDLERSAAIRSGKEKTLGTRFQEGMRKFGRALATGQPQGGMKKGGMVGSASKRADGCAQRGKTKGRMV